ncbi:MAG: hypothetical protein NVSMB56_18050 [Pyrinomonadaceae bacterium]
MVATMTVSGFEDFLARHDESDWQAALSELLPAIHEIDRNATQIWFQFFPLPLARVFQTADDPEQLAKKFLMQGKFQLKDQIDSSHTFLYGHRFWMQVKNTVEERASKTATAKNLASEVREIAARVASELKVDASLVNGITAVALMTLQQTGLEAFKAASGAIPIDKKHAKKSPTQILQERARDDGQGIFGFLRTTDKQWTVTFNENDDTACFKAFSREELASAAARDKRAWHERDERCTIDEGPIPVQCRAASCGTCWVGVLGGAEKLSEVAPLESRRMKLFGYIDTNEPRPLIRLACQAQTTGAVSIVIPPWNGFYGKYICKEVTDDE